MSSDPHGNTDFEAFCKSHEGLAVELLSTPENPQAVLRHSATYYGVAKEHVRALDALNMATENRRRTRARLIPEVVNNIKAAFAKPTDSTVDDAIQLHPEYISARKNELAAMTHEQLWFALRQAHQQRAAHIDAILRNTTEPQEPKQ